MDKRLVFNEIVDEYEKWRPDYVPELYNDLISYSGLKENNRALEIGIGTGKATVPILQTGCRLTAVELGDKLADYSRQKFAGCPNIEIITSSFEDYRCAGNTFDLIYAACSFHWIPEEAGYPKVLELLTPGGTFARFANWQQRDKENAALNLAIQAAYDKHMPGSAAKPDYTEENCKELASVSKKYGFTDICYQLYHRKRTFHADDFVSLQHTHGGHADMNPEKWDLFAKDLRTAIHNNGGLIHVYDVMELQLARKP